MGYESVIREKELAFDAQLSATEIVRRCERRIGELVREGQREGTILKKGANLQGGERVAHLGPAEAAGVRHRSEVRPLYAMADAPAEQFDQAIGKAREEGNLSRANVVRKVKGEAPPATARSKWHHGTAHIDSKRILSTLAQELDAATAGLELMEREALEPAFVAVCTASIRRSFSLINQHLRRIQ